MATPAESLTTIRARLLAELESVQLAPDHTDGSRSEQMSSYVTNLLTQIEKINKLIAQSEHVEVQTIVRPW